MKSRLQLPPEAELSAQQIALRDSILQTRGNLDGPFLPWLMSPQFGDLAQRLGAFCRYQTRLTPQESELLILCVAARFECRGEQQIHEPIAARIGIPAAAIEALRARAWPDLPSPRLSLLHELARALLDSNRLEDALYRSARDLFGTDVLVEAVGVLGYYALTAFTLNAFEVSMT